MIKKKKIKECGHYIKMWSLFIQGDQGGLSAKMTFEKRYEENKGVIHVGYLGIQCLGSGAV